MQDKSLDSISASKKNILFVISKFDQGGSERYLYEICKAIDKTKFNITILTRRNIDRSEYYYPLLNKLGIRIHDVIPERRYFARYLPWLHQTRMGLHILEKVNDFVIRCALRKRLFSYDLIAIIQIENYYRVKPVLESDPRVVIHLMSDAIQYPYDVYSHCTPGIRYRFVLMNPSQESDIATIRSDNIQTFYWPLAIDLSSWEQIVPRPRLSKQPVKIGVFMRLSTERPLEPLFYCFKSLLSYTDAELHVYGKGDPGLFDRTLAFLNIKDKVFFQGHRQDLGACLRAEELNLVWMTSHSEILGYAPIEIAGFGFPMVFWNLGKSSTQDIYKHTGGAINTFSDVVEFVNFNTKLLGDERLLLNLGTKLRQYVIETYDIARHISELENYYERTIEELQN